MKILEQKGAIQPYEKEDINDIFEKRLKWGHENLNV